MKNIFVKRSDIVNKKTIKCPNCKAIGVYVGGIKVLHKSSIVECIYCRHKFSVRKHNKKFKNENINVSNSRKANRVGELIGRAWRGINARIRKLFGNNSK